MFNPLDMLQAQNGAGMQSVAQQFGLTPEQTRRAMEALMPAFALGMQRSAAPDPIGLAQMFGMGGARPAASPAETMLGQLFGSPALTQAILQQASSASGVGSQVLRQMLPMMAGAVVASVVHMLLNQQAPEPKAAPAPAASPFGVSPAWAEMMKAFLPSEAVSEQPERYGAKPHVPKPRVAEPPPRAAATPQAEAPGGMFQQMLKTGAEVQEQNVKAMQGLFEAFWTEADPKTRPAAAQDGSVSTVGPAPAAQSDADPSEGSQKPRRGRTGPR